jgi:integrase
MNSNKTATGKALRGNIGYTTNKSGMVIINMPRTWFPLVKSQIKVPLGIKYKNDNHSLIDKAINRLQIALEDGRLHNPDGTLDKVAYQEVLKPLNIFPNLRGVMRVIEGGKVQEIKKQELGLLEIWDKYCEYRKPSLAISTYENRYRGTFTNFLKDALEEVGDSSLLIREWLIKNRNRRDSRIILSIIEKAYNFAIQNNLYHSKNPYLGFKDDICTDNKNKEIKQEDYKSDNFDLLDKKKSYDWDEVEIILDYIKNGSNKFKEWYHFTAFRFLTGCRVGEAQALFWDDIKWKNECIIFRRNYVGTIKKFKSTKNNTERIFPMKKNSRLWNLLKELKQGNDNDCVFTLKNQNFIYQTAIDSYWRGYTIKHKSKIYEYPGFITQLVEAGKISRYLPPYNTRHSFITHAIYDLGISPDVVNAWCEHSEEVSKKHYRDVTEYAKKFDPEKQVESSNNKSEVELLREMIAKQQSQIEQLSKMVERDT